MLCINSILASVVIDLAFVFRMHDLNPRAETNGGPEIPRANRTSELVILVYVVHSLIMVTVERKISSTCRKVSNR